MFTHKIPFYYLLITTVTGMVFSYLVFQTVFQNRLLRQGGQIVTLETKPACEYSLSRLEGYKFIKPLVMASQSCESEKFSPLKSETSALIDKLKSTGVLSSASFYLRDLKQGEWVSLNARERFDPGSLMKVPLMITMLRMAEDKPGLLDTKLFYEKRYTEVRTPVFTSTTITPGNKYTYRELLRSMIVNSDNEATSLLCDHTDMAAFKKTFTDFGFPEVDGNKMDYPITSEEFSVFMEALYNAGYLTIRDSEFATSLLSGSTFKEGLLSGLPDSIMVAHKFGEAGSDSMHELHESGIIYLRNSPYLLTVMTKGSDLKKLPDVLSSISRSVYNNMERVN